MEIDATGRYLIPGLADMHVHWYDEGFMGLFVANGVTTVRQMWGTPTVQTWRTSIDSGRVLGPRMIIASPVVDGPDPVWAGSMVVPDGASARDAVARIKGHGFDFVKVYNRLPRDAFFSLAREAGAEGMPVAGHVPLAVRASEASDEGLRSIEHLTGVLLGSSSAEGELRQQLVAAFKGGEAGKGIDTETRRSLREIGERLLATYDGSKAAELFSRFARNGTWHCPTLTVLRAMASLDDAAFTNDERLKYIPHRLKERWRAKNDPRLATKRPEDYALDRRVLRKHLEIVGAMNLAGVRFLAGTDVLNPFAFPGFSLHDELALLVDAGLSPLEALQAATIEPARYLGREGEIGTIAAGRAADLVLLEGNPLEAIGETRRIAAVVVRGRFIGRPELDALLRNAEKAASSRATP